ncbi:predicted protein [Postia placenta Mad-698-R]|nr:predicted protein [Postia placenta Mad-698-R]
MSSQEPDELASFDAGASLFAVSAVFPPSVKGGSVGGVRVVVGAGVLGLLPSEAPPKSPPDRADVVVELVVLDELSAGLGTEPKRPPDVPVAGLAAVELACSAGFAPQPPNRLVMGCVPGALEAFVPDEVAGVDPNSPLPGVAVDAAVALALAVLFAVPNKPPPVVGVVELVAPAADYYL